MASKTTKGRKNTRTKRKTGAKAKGSSAKNTELTGEITILITLALCILLVLSNFGIGGIVGEAVSSVLFGLFGYMAYALPFLIFAAAAFFISNKGNTHAYIKITAGVFLFLFLTAILELIFYSYTPGTKLITYYTVASENHNAGGLTGGFLINIFCPLIGEIGTYVVLFILSIICIILITEKSLLAPIGRQSKKAYEDARRKRQETAVLRAKQKEESKRLAEKKKADRYKDQKEAGTEKRIDHKVSGVSFATTLVPEEQTPKKIRRGRKKKFQDMCEITPDDFSENEGESLNTDQDGEMPQVSEQFVINRGEPFSEEVSLGLNGFSEQAEANQPSASFELQEEPADGEMKSKEKREGRKRKAEDAAVVAQEMKNVADAVMQEEKKEHPVYQIPPMNLLKKGRKTGGDSDAHLRATALKLEQTLRNFGVGVHVTNASCGPSVTRYELQPEQGVKVSKIVGLSDDIKLNLAVADLRIEAPIPGKAAVGIEVPNSENTAVMLRDLLESKEFQASASPISFAVGKDISGKVVVSDIAKMPHLLVAGATGSGKSVCINTLIMSIIYKADPEEVKLILVDPKVVELNVYNGIPHLMIPVVTDPKKAAGALNWAVAEMEKRYKLFADYNVRDLKGFNEKVEKEQSGEEVRKKLPQIVIIIDELADLMMVAPGEVENSICRLAQLARAAGIHLILATQRPSVNVITGLIKANMPSRIAFSVSSGVDSRTIIDMNGAEKLLGKGDMLFYPSGYPKPVRVQGSFVSDKEVQDVVDYLINHSAGISYNNELEEHMNTNAVSVGSMAQGNESGEDHDTYFVEAGKLIIEKEKASIGMLQRMFKIGFNRAARIMDQLAEAGVVGPEEGTKPRKVLMTEEEFETYLQKDN